jgi:hypothetical protein
MKFSYSAIWDDTARMLRSHGSLFLALAGVFFLLPALLTGYLIPAPTGQASSVGAMMGYYRENWLWVLIGNLVNAIGAVSIYLLLFDRRGGTVGSAIAAALPIVPLYFLLSVLVSLLIGFGLALFIIPGIYLLGRIAISGTVMIAENRKSPFNAISAAWRLTRGKGWAVAGLVLLVGIAGGILSFAIAAVLGTVFILVGGREGIGGLLVLILSSALMAAFLTVLIVLLAAIYRRLASASSAAPAAEQGELRGDVPRE